MTAKCYGTATVSLQRRHGFEARHGDRRFTGNHSDAGARPRLRSAVCARPIRHASTPRGSPLATPGRCRLDTNRVRCASTATHPPRGSRGLDVSIAVKRGYLSPSTTACAGFTYDKPVFPGSESRTETATIFDGFLDDIEGGALPDAMLEPRGGYARCVLGRAQGARCRSPKPRPARYIASSGGDAGSGTAPISVSVKLSASVPVPHVHS